MNEADDRCMEHTGRDKGHTTFARRFEDVVLVERLEGSA